MPTRRRGSCARPRAACAGAGNRTGVADAGIGRMDPPAADERRRNRQQRRRARGDRPAGLAVSAVRASGRRRRAIPRAFERALGRAGGLGHRLDNRDAAGDGGRLPPRQAKARGVNPFRLWVYLQTAPLFWLTATLGAYLIADALARVVGRHPLANTVLISVALVAVLLKISATAYQTYFNGAQFVHFLLGPATVALAVPLYRNLALARENLLPMAAALVVGALVAIVSAVVIAAALGAPRVVLISLAPKSVTAAVAMAVSERAGGLPSLTAALVILTGVIGAIVVTPMMNALRIRDYAARGFAAGMASHGIGTARAFTVDPLAGAFAGIAMGLNAVATPIMVPLILPWLIR